MAHPGIQAHVIVNGEPLVEFDDEDDEGVSNKVFKYIECQSGAEFAIRCQVSKQGPGCTLRLQVKCEGNWGGGTYLEQTDHMGDTATALFCFSELKIDASDPPAVTDKLMRSLKHTGELTLTVHRVKNLRVEQKQHGSRKSNDIENVPEKVLKGRTLSHQSRYSCTSDYRITAALQSLLIIPRTPGPVPLEDRDVDTLTAEESRELILRLREREKSAVQVKKETIKREISRDESNTVPGSNDESDDISILLTKRRRMLPVIVDEHGVETIDLT
ncbi:hypothetical protein T440DRAFT_534572 [Plenodomus tracheiphilus IPT5]|uniref:DUF7918 domain-containing protein n=1 Tax=Plenodomus tracheiphilus IPT5 TaxID=1408161 RepID=A0A6A7B305_9PLEO|nr:hypothetical protein T440DRAFT_534572 [Plenodomus tracheiphilus IPT5]